MEPKSDAQRTPYQPDPRIPKFYMNRIVVFSIPQEVTQEQLHELFSKYGVLESEIRYRNQEETGDSRGGMAFIKFESNEDCQKFMTEGVDSMDLTFKIGSA